MFEKIAVRKTWKKLNSGIQNSILEMAYLDKNLNSKTYSKEQYLLDCKKLTSVVENLMQNQQIASSIDSVVEVYPFEDAVTKLEGFATDIKMLKKSVAYCKLKLDEKEGIYEIIKRISIISENNIYNSNILTTNARHYEAMKQSLTALKTAKENLINGSPTDIIAIDIRESLHYLGEITGEVTTEEVLSNVFSKFCIGK